MLRRAAALALAVLATACGGDGGSGDRTITVAGQPVAVAPLVDAHAALCQAVAEPEAAYRHFFDRAQAAQLLQAKERVESELTNPPPTFLVDLRRLAAVYRDGLGRLAITAPPCDK